MVLQPPNLTGNHYDSKTLCVVDFKRNTVLLLGILQTYVYGSFKTYPNWRFWILCVNQNFKSQNNEIYNKDFNLDELVEAIQLSHDSATGPDEIHYQMLKHLPDTSLETLLNIFNYIWSTGIFPEDWTLATIIPIPKPGKDPAEPNN